MLQNTVSPALIETTDIRILTGHTAVLQLLGFSEISGDGTMINVTNTIHKAVDKASIWIFSAILKIAQPIT